MGYSPTEKEGVVRLLTEVQKCKKPLCVWWSGKDSFKQQRWEVSVPCLEVEGN